MVGVGVCLMLGFGAERNVSEAMGWLRKGAEGGHVVGMVGYGSGLVHGVGGGDAGAGVQWLRKAVGQGSGVAMELLRHLGVNRVRVGDDERSAMEWMARAAEVWARSVTKLSADEMVIGRGGQCMEV
jgi:hypothetical protein